MDFLVVVILLLLLPFFWSVNERANKTKRRKNDFGRELKWKKKSLIHSFTLENHLFHRLTVKRSPHIHKIYRKHSFCCCCCCFSFVVGLKNERHRSSFKLFAFNLNDDWAKTVFCVSYINVRIILVVVAVITFSIVILF